MAWWQVVIGIWGLFALGILCETGWIIARGFKDVLAAIDRLEAEFKRQTEQVAYIKTLLRTRKE
jgi:hypothetical protein